MRSEKELRERLKKKKFNDEAIRETIAFLKDKNFINDCTFAHKWLESRIRKPLGLRKIKQELKIKGISPEIIDKEFNALKVNYSEENVLLRIIKEKSDKLKTLDPQKAKRRIYAYLLRRGFSPETVIEAMKKL